MIIVLINIVCLISSLCVNSFSSSIANVSNQLGADIVIVSDEYDSSMQEMLFMGYPSTILFDSSFINEIKELDGIENVSEQVFLSSLNSSCCEEQVQFIIFNEDTDLLIQSLTDEYKSYSDTRDIIVGANVHYEVGDTATFFDCVFCVAGKLKATGMGYDDCIFVNKTVSESITNFLRIDASFEQSSMVLVNIDVDVNIDEIMNTIDNSISGYNVSAYKTNEFYSGLSNSIEQFTCSSRIFVGLIEAISCLAIFAIFSLSVDLKKNSFRTIHLLGINNKWKAIIVITEGFIIATISSLIGNFLALGLILIFQHTIESITLLPVSFSIEVIWMMLKNYAISVIIVILASVYSAYWVSNVQNKEEKRKYDSI